MIRYRRDLWQVLLPGPGVEIGVAEGNFSEDMLRWKRPDGAFALNHLYMVDRWDQNPAQKGDGGFPRDWHENNLMRVRMRTAAYGERARILRGDSAEMAEAVPNRSLALVYVDGDHSYEGVMADIQAWRSKLMPGGVMAFHDFLNRNYGVGDAVRDYVSTSYETIHIISEDKIEDAGAWFYANSI